jgi:Dicarboxylate transport
VLTQRYQVAVLLGLVCLLGGYLLLPLCVSYLLAKEFRDRGYRNVILQLGYPGWNRMNIPVVSFQQALGEERLLVSLTDVEIGYDLAQLVQGRASRIVLRDMAVHILNVPSLDLTNEENGVADHAKDEESPWNLLTAGDLLRSLPILPFDELQLTRLTIFREQATGPLRKVTVDGTVTYQGGELGGHLSFQGRETASYGLTVTGHSASTWSATLGSQRSQTAPIVAWQSQAHPNGSEIQVNGRLQINVQELAPFIALLIPIGPELEKVTGNVAIDWAGNAAAEATLSSLWKDTHTHLDGNIRVNVTLPALKGVAKDIVFAYEGTFGGNAAQVGWTLAPGVLLTATMNTQPRIIPEVVRSILPHGDQPVRIENREVIQGRLYWAETPVRMIAEGPMHVTYGRTTGPLVARFETTRAEGLGNELVVAEGAYDLEGQAPQAVLELLAAKEATGGVRGTVKLARTHIQGVLFPSSSLTARQLERGQTSIPTATMHLSEALQVECDLTAPRCHTEPATVAIRVPTMRIKGRQIQVARASLRMQQLETEGAVWNTQGILTVDDVAVTPVAWIPPLTDWQMRFSANQTGIKADLRIDVPNHEGFATIKVEQPLNAREGVLHGTIGPLDVHKLEGRFSKIVMGLPPSTEVVDGTLTVTFDASWSGSSGNPFHDVTLSSASAKLVAEKLSGHYDDYVVKGFTTSAAFRNEGADVIALTQPAPIHVSSVHTGVDVLNLAASVQMRWRMADELPIIEVKELQCEMFGGTVTSPGAVIELGKLPFTTTFALQNFDLSKILSIEQQKSLNGTGTLHGTIPVIIGTSGISVKNGLVEAQSPGGVIRYAAIAESSKVISESDSQLSLMTQALNNFHYTVLRVGVKYGENGMLDLNARLEGRNPDLKTVPPIHFNLAVQEHIPTLLKSLRLVDEIQGSLEKRYKRL